MLGFDARNDQAWWADDGDVVAATTLAPAALPVTLTPADVPLQMSAAIATTTTLSE